MMDALCFDLKQPVYEGMLHDISQASMPAARPQSPMSTELPPYTATLPDATVEMVRSSLIENGKENEAHTVK
jgi:hypothetical protein